jgi:hypothetical protein
MLTPLQRSFPHRHNANGTHDSICTVCFATVATVRHEWELTYHEFAHACQPINLYRVSQGVLPRPRVAFELSPKGNQLLQPSRRDRTSLLPSHG